VLESLVAVVRLPAARSSASTGRPRAGAQSRSQRLIARDGIRVVGAVVRLARQSRRTGPARSAPAPVSARHRPAGERCPSVRASAATGAMPPRANSCSRLSRRCRRARLRRSRVRARAQARQAARATARRSRFRDRPAREPHGACRRRRAAGTRHRSSAGRVATSSRAVGRKTRTDVAQRRRSRQARSASVFREHRTGDEPHMVLSIRAARKRAIAVVALAVPNADEPDRSARLRLSSLERQRSKWSRRSTHALSGRVQLQSSSSQGA
jgi:hypothetical protein